MLLVLLEKLSFRHERYVCLKLLSRNLGWKKHRLVHSSNAMMTKKIEDMVKNIKDTMNVRQEVSVAYFYYSHFLLQSIKKILSLHWCLSNCQAQGQASTPKVKKPAFGKQKVAGQQIVIQIPSVEDLLKESEVDKGEEGILLKEINSKIESDQTKLMEEIKKIKDLQLQNNEDLKKIVAEHSILSKMYNEIKKQGPN